MKILIKNIDILTMNEENLIINYGYICIDNDKIIYVGKDEPVIFNPDKIIDGTNKLAMPGLINSHTHSATSLLRSYADDMPLEESLFDYIFPVEAKLTGQDVYWGSMLSFAEMIKSGTTTFSDHYFYMNEIADATTDAGLRAILSRTCQKFNADDKNAQVKLNESVELYNKFNNKGDGLINIFIGPHSVYTCTPEYLQECYSVAKQLNTGLHIHLSETITENKNCKYINGVTSIEHCYNLGILDKNVVAAHCTNPSKKEIEILKHTGVNIVHTPDCNLKLGSGIAPIPKYLEKGINVALGTDGASSSNNINMFEEIHMAGVIHKGATNDATVIKAYEVLKMATVNGAKAYGLNDVGQIKADYKADIIILDMDKPHFYPKHNIISNLVYSAQGSDVETVIVNGKVLLENNQYMTIDFEKVKHNIDKIQSRIFEKLGGQIWKKKFIHINN